MYLELQKLIFENVPTRRELINYHSKLDKGFRVQVFRNHSFELVEHTLDVYLDYAGLGIEFFYSGYDDSLSFTELDTSADLVLLWIDTTRYEAGTAQAFLNERITQLQLQFSKPVLLVPFGEKVMVSLSGVTVMDLYSIENELGMEFTDVRAKVVSGTALSSKAMLLISRALGLQYLPALLRPALKAIVVDLDNTLYNGVLGEDGIDGVNLTQGHKHLQEVLQQFVSAGFFLCVASKNDFSDVEHMFERRKDFPLKKGDFTKINASWEPKTDAIQKISEFLNINIDSIVFIDDNIGELIAVKTAFPDIKVIHAKEDAEMTCRVIKEFPGILKLNRSVEDSIRKVDVQANLQRKELQEILSPEEYIRSLKLQLTFDYNNAEQVGRISELANKTNQFILNYKRYTPSEVEMRIKSEKYIVVSISLADKLSDSGLVGVCVGKDQKDFVEIEECFISCRALGRGIDDIMVLGAISGIAKQFNKSKIKVLFQKGPRNAPAELFVNSKFAQYLDSEQEFSYVIPENLLTVRSITNERRDNHER